MPKLIIIVSTFIFLIGCKSQSAIQSNVINNTGEVKPDMPESRPLQENSANENVMTNKSQNVEMKGPIVVLKPLDHIDMRGWKIEYSSPIAIAFKDSDTISGRLEMRKGNFSTWLFCKNISACEETGIETIFNEKTGLIFGLTLAIQAGGPFLDGVSEDGTMVSLDFGTGPGVRGVEIWDEAGNKVHKDSYMDMHWEHNTLVYSYPEKNLPINLNEETRACQSVGTASLVKERRFSRKGIETGSDSRIVCSN